MPQPSRRSNATAHSPSPSRSWESSATEEANVLVTGFDIFGASGPSNPSWSIARALPSMLPATPVHPSRIRICIPPKPVTVAYDAVDELIPELYNGATKYDAVVHIGLAPRRSHYSLETTAHRDGYDKLDVYNQLPRPSVQAPFRRECPPELKTSAHIPDVWPRWSGVLPEYDVRLSDDPGRYVCDYIYYTSLAYFHHHNSDTLPWQERTSVVFLHVPPEDKSSVEAGVEATTALIRALVDSRRMRQDDYAS